MDTVKRFFVMCLENHIQMVISAIKTGKRAAVYDDG